MKAPNDSRNYGSIVPVPEGYEIVRKDPDMYFGPAPISFLKPADWVMGTLLGTGHQEYVIRQTQEYVEIYSDRDWFEPLERSVVEVMKNITYTEGVGRNGCRGEVIAVAGCRECYAIVGGKLYDVDSMRGPVFEAAQVLVGRRTCSLIFSKVMRDL